MKLYHIHLNSEYNDLFKEGATLHPGQDFNLLHQHFLMSSSSYLVKQKEIDNKTFNFYNCFDEYFGKKLRRKNITKVEFKRMAEFIKMYVHDSSMDFRELILEEIRREYYSNLPSRYKCMWLTDRDSISHWIETLRIKRGYQVFKVEVNGNIFTSADSLLPPINLPHGEIYDLSHKYWNPDSSYLEQAKDREYLVEGEVKLLEKLVDK